MIRVLRIALVALVPALATASCRDYQPQEGPEQPIAFYHSVHAGENQIPCMYCHYTADRAPTAGIPSVRVCVGCHILGGASEAQLAQRGQAQIAFPTAERDTFWFAEASKIAEYWKNAEGIPWVKIHDLPEHVKFPHYSHVNAGLECQTCHGPVQEMEKVYQFSSLQMGWCVSCHRGEMEISEAEERAIAQRSGFRRKLAALKGAGGDIRGHQALYPNQRASVDCFVCHY